MNETELIIKKGNKDIRDIPIRDRNGTLITTLATATEIRFNIKDQENAAPLVEKTVDDGIEIDTPSTGYVRLTLMPADTDLTPRLYFMGLQIVWIPDDEVYEIYLKVDGIYTDRLRVVRDIVNTPLPGL